METQWNEIRDILGKMLESGIFRVFVAPLEGMFDGNVLHVGAPNTFMAEWVKRHILPELAKAANQVLGQNATVSIEVGQAARKPVSAREALGKIIPQRQADLPVKPAPLRQTNTWRYTFDDFVTGPSNNFAVAAARDMTQNGQVRTLYVNSAVGLGKTHLAQAAGQYLSTSATSANPIKVAYLTADQFASRYVAAMKSRELEDFKQYLCGVDVLLFEDVHFLQRKKAMQEMILGVIKNLQAKGSRVIFTSSFSPRQLRDMDEELVSQFCSGIVAPMEKPDIDMRREILRRKAKSFQVLLPDEICDLLSRSLSSDVRQLESCLRNMVFKARLLNSGLSVDLALETINQYAGAENCLNVENIIRLVCESFGLSRLQLCSSSRRQAYVQGRNTVFYLARKHTDMSLEEIGCVFNRRHSTVLRGITQVEQELARESQVGMQIARAVALIEKKCGVA